MMNDSYPSWGRYPKATQRVFRLDSRHAPIASNALRAGSILPRGNGRSYGDVCLNDAGTLLDCRRLDHFLGFDDRTGVIRCEAGVLLRDILRVSTPRGWFLPVTPGTQLVTVGGAIANDVHGKNHRSAGTFGCHVSAFELLRSDGERLLCSPDSHRAHFEATIGGLGLTGIITWAEIRLRPIEGPLMHQQVTRFRDLGEYFDLVRDNADCQEYSVAWVDCQARHQRLGRGVFISANHAPDPDPDPAPRPRRWRPSVPFDPPFALLGGHAARLMNALYYHRHGRKRVVRTQHFEPFFYPLDSVRDWNRVYGSRGFFQHQCVIPAEHAEATLAQILRLTSTRRAGSFLAVLKRFGERRSPGLLSFPLPGFTLALDFPNQGPRTLRLLADLDAVVHEAGGRINPSKDARMHARDFQRHYPAWHTLESLADPRISSTFWRRVTKRP